jgi:hypothetical protein
MTPATKYYSALVCLFSFCISFWHGGGVPVQMNHQVSIIAPQLQIELGTPAYTRKKRLDYTIVQAGRHAAEDESTGDGLSLCV